MIKASAEYSLVVLFFLSLLSFAPSVSVNAQEAVVTFVNVLQKAGDDSDDHVVALFWQDVSDSTNLVQVASIQPGEGIRIDSHVGHSFVYTLPQQQDQKITETVTSAHVSFIIGPDEVDVDCQTSTGIIHTHIRPHWSPFGAARFLKLVDIGYFDGCALNRAVPNFLVQFGISADFEKRTQWRSANILDDHIGDESVPDEAKSFQAGYLSYAGSGADSRSTEIFVVRSDTPQRQIDAFGSNSWETPFGFVDPDDVSTVVAKWYAYGDMPPWGQGPDPQKIYKRDGYDTYLKTQFPKMSYIQQCQIVGDKYYSRSGEEEEEL